MSLFAALIYWVIVALWLTVLGTIIFFYIRNPRTFGTTRLLLAVLTIDTARNILENTYFGLYFGGKYGLFSQDMAALLGQPILLIIPKSTPTIWKRSQPSIGSPGFTIAATSNHWRARNWHDASATCAR
jgi:hypothetical protein